MKNNIFIALLFLLTVFTTTVNAQEHKHKKIKALKIAYITEQLDLTEKEAENFWPIYNAFQKEYDDLREQMRIKIRKNGNNELDITESDAKKVVLKKLDVEKKLFESHKNYINKLSKVLSYEKILKLQMAERGFKRELFHKLRKRKKSNKK